MFIFFEKVLRAAGGNMKVDKELEQLLVDDVDEEQYATLNVPVLKCILMYCIKKLTFLFVATGCVVGRQ